MNEPQKKVATFLTLMVAFSSIFDYLMISAGSIRSAGGAYVIGVMWSPGVAALLTQLIFRRSLKGLGWGWGEWKYQWQSYLIPLGYAAVAYILVWGLGLGGFPNAVGVAETAARFGLEDMSSEILVAARFLYVAVVGVPFGLITATGEEIGWRGLLVPELAKVTTFTKTALISGGVWAVWHYPGILFVDYNNPGIPVWFSLMCFTVMVVAIGFLFAWMRLRSGSLWTGAVLHASHNAFIQGYFTPMTADTGMTRYFIDEFGIMVPIVTVMVAVLFWHRRKELPVTE